MRKCLSLSLALLLVFSFISATAFAQANSKVKTAKPSKANGKVASIDYTNGQLVLETKRKTTHLVIDSHTTIKIAQIKNATIEDIWVGDRATTLYKTSNGVHTVKSIHVVKQKGSLKGKVEAVDTNASTLTVAGKTAHVPESAIIKLGKERITLEEIAVGDRVEIKGFMKEGVLQARTIQVKSQASVIKGDVEFIDLESGTLVVDGKDVVVTEKTKIRLNGVEASLEDILIGDEVVARGKKEGDGLTAQMVNVKRKPVEIEGKIEYVDADANTVTIDGVTLMIDENTNIVADDEDHKLGWLDLVEGVEAEAKAMQIDEDIWVALEIKVQLDDGDHDDDHDDDHDVDED